MSSAALRHGPADTLKEMQMYNLRPLLLLTLCLSVVTLAARGAEQSVQAGSLPAYTFSNVKDFGAAGTKGQDARETMEAIQKAIDSCAAGGGGLVYVPPGEYVTAPLRLSSNIRFHIEAGAVIYASRDSNDWNRGGRALISGRDLQNVTIEGRGIVDGRAEHAQSPYTEKQDREIQYRIAALKKDKPADMPFWRWTPPAYRLVQLQNCTDVRITGVTLMNSPLWCVHLVACDRVVIDGVYVYSSLVKGVNSDGIDPDGCRDVRISNCTIATGDDCIAIKNGPSNAPGRACENITISNCRLTSASTALKIGSETAGDIKHVTMDNCVVRNSNHGLAFMILDGGTVSDVIISNITMECTRHDWFWWGQGDAFYFKIAKRREESPIGKVENILIKDVVAHVKGSSIIVGHPDSPLTGVRFENVKLFISEDLNAYFKEAVHAVAGGHFKDLVMKDVEVVWGEPGSEKWKSALCLEAVDGLTLDGFTGRQAHPGSDEPAVLLRNVANTDIRLCRAAEGTGQFLRVEGPNSKDIRLFGSDFSRAKNAYSTGEDAGNAVTYTFANAGNKEVTDE